MFRYCPSCASPKIRFEEGKVFRCPDCGFTYYHNTAAATACIVRGAAGLLFLVRNRDPGKGLLDLPGGFVDPGEGAIDGLRREFIEELGFDPLAASPPLDQIMRGEACSKLAPLVASPPLDQLRRGEACSKLAPLVASPPLAPTACGVFRCPPLSAAAGDSAPVIKRVTGTENTFTLFASFPNVYPYKNITYNTCDLFFYIDLPDLREDDLRLEEAEVSAVRFIKPGDLDLESIAFESAKKAVKRYLELFW